MPYLQQFYHYWTFKIRMIPEGHSMSPTNWESEITDMYELGGSGMTPPVPVCLPMDGR